MGEKRDHLGRVLDDLHRSPTQHVRRSDQHGVADGVSGLHRLLERVYGGARRLGDAEALEKTLEEEAIFRRVDSLCTGADYRQSGPAKRVGDIDRRLSSELHDRGHRVPVVRRFVLKDVQHALVVQGFEVQTVARVEVGRDGLRVGVRHDGAIAGPLESPGCVDAGVVELDALADPDRTAPHDQSGGAVLRQRLILDFVGGIEVRGCCVELRSARVHHLVDGLDSPLATGLPDLVRKPVTETAHHLVAESHSFGLAEERGGERFVEQSPFHLNNVHDPLEEPRVDARFAGDLRLVHVPSQCRHDGPEPLIRGLEPRGLSRTPVGGLP